MFALFALIPAKDWLYCIAIAALLCGAGWYTHKERVYGEAHELAALQKSSAELTNANASKLAKQAAADAANLDAIEKSHAQALTASNAATAALAQRLRNYESAARRSAAVSRGAAPASGSNVAAGQSDGVDQAVSGIIVAAGSDAAKVIALQKYISTVCLK
jgi:flagellar biosynthesis component FlhA